MARLVFGFPELRGKSGSDKIINIPVFEDLSARIHHYPVAVMSYFSTFVLQI
ncbi:MAG: hypothetical protein F6J90_33850 [Moorea sp. SIOASIH]|uniref:hypothetical protein n=1 Tax=Moorena sp. SIOASIH TaxID=2607817 RepID=UPI0013B72451|nr:hypothetical protein [Moorena sp. SIOASIH]NEO41043.1 hypothetical protein [Moorena sp. SIOASIH]